ncbi:MAG: hypothetical protein OEV40_20910 [Acidimicrobiia bacterium]|nr:hypothetical protein [Acidimicrobiia bacterium]
MTEPIVDRRIATADPPPTGIPNPIHDGDGADAAGYAGALVAGVRTYGWAAQTITRALGDGWLTIGWVDFTLRRPLFAGEEVTITVRRSSSGAGVWDVACAASGRGGDRLVLDGTAGIGEAAWLPELDPPEPAPGQDPPPVRPTYDLDTIPVGEPLRPLRVFVKPDAARRLATDDLAIEDTRFTRSDRPLVHPYFLAGRMAPLTRHNFTYGPTIHVRSQIQHRGEARAGQDITVGARIVDAYDRNDHWYQVLDGVVTGSEADAEHGAELARIRHHTIFRPRGTTMPAPIRS